MVFYLLSGQGPASSIILLLWSFCHRAETVQPGVRLSPASISVPGWRVVPFSEKGNSGRRSSLGRALGRQIKLKGI